MALRPCLVCGTLCKHSRCPRHRLRADPTSQQQLGTIHKAIKKATVERWVRKHGWICPGWEREEHPVPPGGLTGDHIISRKVRPDLAHNPENYAVLCLRCNSAKGSR